MSDRVERDWLSRVSVPVVVGGLAGLIGIVLVAYFWAFGDRGCCDQSAWGQFGDFVGGTLNPVLGALSASLLFVTFREQRRMLEEQRRMLRHTKTQAVVEELQRLAASIATRLDDVLARKPELEPPLKELWDRHKYQARGGPAYGEVPPPHVIDIFRMFHQVLRSATPDGVDSAVRYMLDFHDVHTGLLRLHQCLTEFHAREGDLIIIRLYGTQYSSPLLVVCALNEIGKFRQFNKPIEFPNSAIELFGLQEEFESLRPGIEAIGKALEFVYDREQQRLANRGALAQSIEAHMKKKKEGEP